METSGHNCGNGSSTWAKDSLDRIEAERRAMRVVRDGRFSGRSESSPAAHPQR